MSKYLDAALKAAEASGKILKKNFNKGVKAIHKGNMHYVTLADYASQATIKDIIKKDFPKHNIFSEEDEYEDKGSEYTWYIDPLDGTHNYMRNIPIFGNSIALLRNNTVIAGVLHFPLLNRTYYAEKGKGAFMNKKRLHVSKFKPEHNYTALLELKKESREKLLRLFKAIEHEQNWIRAIACASYSLALVAEGNVDVFLPFYTNLYDVASGILLIEEAGGRVTNIHGKKWNKETKDYLLTNWKLHNRMLHFIKKADI